MAVVNATEARRNLFSMINLALENERVTITSKTGNAVLISEEELNSILETLYLLSDPETLPAMKEVLETPPSEREVWHCPKDMS
ncbi:MAG: type II toxin-antitoxin system Phd/YefM family antitoxin [Methanomassiliicoccaceae archaeon]|nr:type II toxin-antitoxin system Phd/YefM family antitoxin [Methanomassiliicoccaceae archaeon]